MDSGWMYAANKIAAARDVARLAYNDIDAEIAIASEYGVFLDDMTDDEVDEFYSLVDSYR